MSVLDALEDLLLAEQRLIRNGNLSDLERTAALKDRLLEGLGSAGQYPAEDLRRLREIAEVNARLLEAAGRGLKSALRQIEDLKQAAMPSTYTREGTRRALGSQSSQLQQKL